MPSFKVTLSTRAGTQIDEHIDAMGPGAAFQHIVKKYHLQDGDIRALIVTNLTEMRNNQ